MEDAKIIELFFSRSEDAISQMDCKYGRYCRYIAGNILGDRQDAEECVSDAYMSAWRAIPPQRPQNLKTFLGRLARNAAIHRLEQNRAAKRGGGEMTLVLEEMEECLASAGSAEDSCNEAALLDCLNAFLASLPDAKRNIFVRRYWYASSIASIAAEYEMSESKVKSMLFRLRKQLKAALYKEGIFL